MDSKKKKIDEEISKPETFEHLHHKPVSRRDFLSAGLIQFSASMFMPSFLQLFARGGVAQAQDLVCQATGASDLCTFVGIKLSGGAAMSANFVPHEMGLQPLKSYSKIGLGLGGSLPLVYDFANKAPFYALSQMLAGIKTGASAATLAKASFVGAPLRAQDDSSMNKFDLTGLVATAGLRGKILPNLGRTNTETGVGALPAYLKPPVPLIVSSYDDIVGSLGVSGSLAALSSAQKASLFGTISGLTASQVGKIESLNGGAQLSRLIQCANKDNTNLISNTQNLNTDPLGNADFAAVWGINGNTSKASQAYVFAAMVYNALNGNTGTVNLDMGGYDYHNGSRTSGDTKDLEAGVVIGRVLQSMAVMNKKGFIVVTSDGGVSSPESDVAGGPWVSDRGISSSAYMIGFDPLGAHQVQSFQMGHFTEDQVADDNFVTGANPEITAGGIFANYLAFNGKVGLTESYLPRVFTTEQLGKIIKFS